MMSGEEGGGGGRGRITLQWQDLNIAQAKRGAHLHGPVGHLRVQGPRLCAVSERSVYAKNAPRQGRWKLDRVKACFAPCRCALRARTDTLRAGLRRVAQTASGDRTPWSDTVSLSRDRAVTDRKRVRSIRLPVGHGSQFH